MKRLITAFALSSAVYVYASAYEVTDTVASLTNATGVTVTMNDSDVSIKVSDSDTREWLEFSNKEVPVDSLDSSDGAIMNFSFPFSNEDDRSKFMVLGVKDIFCEYSMPTGGIDCVRGAYTLGIGSIIGFCWSPSKKTSLMLGGGFQSTHRSLKTGYSFTPSPNGAITPTNGIQGTDHSHAYSKLVTSDILLSLYLTPRLYRSFSMRLSVTACFEATSYACNRYYKDGVQYTEKIKNLMRRTMTPMFSFGLGWDNWIGLYVKYNPCSLFKNNSGPDFKSISAGISLAF